jgi:hypothetical protein
LVGERCQGDLPVVVIVDLKLGSCLSVGCLFEPKIGLEPRHEARITLLFLFSSLNTSVD